MAEALNSFGLNATYVEILRSQWQADPVSVPEEWRAYFSDGTPAVVAKAEPAPVTKKIEPETASASKTKTPLVGIASKIVENMELSLQVPTATSLKDIPVKVLEENREMINDYLIDEAYPKCSFTHLIAFAIVQALKTNPALNNGFSREDTRIFKVTRPDINLGLAIDLPARDGGRTLVVPNLKACQNMDFWTFFKAYNALIDMARKNQLKPEDFDGTTVTLTNPGGIGTVSSTPRLMPGQGCIIATGRIGYPAQFEATSPETLRGLGIGKVMTVTSTYDHRVIQGAESGHFLAQLHELLIGADNFYDQVFEALRIPHHPYVLKADQAVVLGQNADSIQTERAMRVSQLIHAYRVRGCLLAHTDPLHLSPRQHPELDLQNYGLTIWDLDRDFDTLGTLPQKSAPLRLILKQLRNAYCRRMGVEYMYMHEVAQKASLQKRIEHEQEPFNLLEKKQILTKLLQAEGFEHFLHKRFIGHKRFSIEGAEVLIPMLQSLLEQISKAGAEHAIIGMAHRGRLNVLANVVGKPHAAIFAEFDDIDPKSFQGSGDVKYHLGAKGKLTLDGKEMQVELACNPSHLEAVNPVVEGQARAKQDWLEDVEREKVVPILIHGDAAFAMQGVVYEVLQMSTLEGYRTGGTIHIVVNNQIGYTTAPEKARSSLNCTDIARAINAPVFRVNGDDPEACLRAIKMATEYRTMFKRDVVIDLVCYRRYGHNEGDEPSFTQPILYAAIQKHPSVATLYAELLMRRGDLQQDELRAMEESHTQVFENALSAVREKGQGALADFIPAPEFTRQAVPLFPKKELERMTEALVFEPEGIELHPRVKAQVLDKRRAMIFEGKPGIDFGMAETLAYATLLQEKTPVRISGQDCGRGTFAHRHAVLYDVNTGKPYIPLQQFGNFQIYDSPLSEEGVLGFEYGYSLQNPEALVIWEAQFGDFFNGAQIQIDQFIASSEAKWGKTCRLTLFLPHGYDGQGPEHSSARLERFLQLCAQDNWRIANCTTPAQFYHLLRRQAKDVKKPLVVFTHKSLLRAEDAASQLSELTSGQFDEVLLDPRAPISKKTKRLILCSGKVYWDLDRWRQQNKLGSEVSIWRLEQLYPLNLPKLPAVKDIVWLQEEPKNCGAYLFAQSKLKELGVMARYIGRRENASPATGSPKVHARQQQAIMEAAFDFSKDQSADIDVA
ncbi:MAG: multifunctional oxoglutarate decarboxylase/oxoglutarate dehydrogenase thiamine pyrophosphate-binding subunit/dihydrolipoyllysine-residue succinyltransferase subunit [Myxococcota bacterium]